MSTTKQFTISKNQVLHAFKRVKANAGSAGIDGQSIEDFEKDLKRNLYKIWNRMSSGSYFPPPVKAVAIPKKSGGERILGIPTVSDRVAQMVVKLSFKPLVEPHFLDSSYAYRPGRSALDAVKITRYRCWLFPWVVEFDIVGLFDNIPHDLMMKAVRQHTSCKWTLLYIERWLKAPIQHKGEEPTPRSAGTPQGRVISPVLANLFLHYVFDKWMEKNHPNIPWCRYADDGLLHCWSNSQAKFIRRKIEQRFRECCLELHPKKTKIVSCKDGERKESYPVTSFDFLGFTFRRRRAWNDKRQSLFVHFAPGVSKDAMKSMRWTTRKRNFRNRTELSLQDIAMLHNRTIRGWFNYYGKFCPSGMYPVSRHLNQTLVQWAMRKHKRFRINKTRASNWLLKISKENTELFEHWRRGFAGSFV